MSLRSFAVSLVVPLFAPIASSPLPAAPLFHFTEQPGPLAVGLKVVEQYDYSRAYRRTTDALGQPYRGERTRPLQTLIWYPATSTHAKPMTVGDYVDLWTTETRFGRPRMPAKGEQWRAGVQRSLTSALWAVRDAPMSPGRFPVVVYAPGGFGEAWDNADLCEYLASHGYVVIAAPMMGSRTREMTADLAGIDAPAQDISFLIGYAQTLPNTDMSAVAAMGMSWGGIASLFAAARDSRIDALVGLDGSLRYFPGLVKAAGDVHPEDMTIPLLAFVQRNASLENLDHYSAASTDGPNVFNAWTHGDLIFIRMLGLNHGFITSAFPRNDDVWWDLDHLYPETQGDYGPEDVAVGYGWVARYTLKFLDAYLKHDAAASAFLKQTPTENGVPRHLMEFTYRAGHGIPASFDGLRREAGRRGFAELPQIYAEMVKEKSDFKPEGFLLSDWGTELIDEGHFREAVEVLRLDNDLYPGSGAGYQLLGDAYRGAGQRDHAIEAYRKAVDQDPLDGDPKRKLAAMEGQH